MIAPRGCFYRKAWGFLEVFLTNSCSNNILKTQGGRKGFLSANKLTGKEEGPMKRKNVLVSLVLVSLFMLAFVANQAYTQSSPETASGTERIVELFIKGCD